MSDMKKTCFVITPIGEDNSDIRRHIDGIIDQVIEPAIGEKYDIVVSHRKFEIGSINDKIIKSIYESDLVIANLTTTNPNVMFELGIRYSFGKPAIVIAEKGTKLPFDVVDENTIFYVNDLVGADDLKKEICKYEEKIDIEKKDYGPVFKVINKIPLYSEVESGKDVSNKKLLEYIIDRLDNIEKKINLEKKKINEASKVFEKWVVSLYPNDNIGIDEIEDVLSRLKTPYLSINMETVAGSARYYISGSENEVNRFLDDIKEWVMIKKINYSIKML